MMRRMGVQAGDQVTANVRLVKELGAGGMGSVWVADHLTLHNRVAVKFIHLKTSENKQKSAAKRFSREAALAAKIQHPHVVQMFDHGVTDAGIPYIVMELLEGESLKERLDHGSLTTGQVQTLLMQIAKVLERAHDSGIIHRDLKPANLFLVDSGYDVFVKVLDFGIAKQLRTDDMDLTESSALVGTPLFMSKEALVGRQKLDHRADLWSLGVLIYYALTKHFPFQGETFAEQVLVVHDGKLKPVSHLLPEAPPELDSWFRRCFAKDIDKRWQSANEMATAFAEALGSMESNSKAMVSGDAEADPQALLSTVAADDATDAQPVQPTLGGSTTTSSRQRPSRPMWTAAAMVVGAAGLAFYVTSGSTEGDDLKVVSSASAVSASAVSASASAPLIVSTASSATPAPSAVEPARVSVQFDVPVASEVWRGGKLIGKTPGPIVIERGDDSIELEIRATGHASKTVTITPNKDQTVKVRLTAPARPPKPSDGLKW